MLVSLRPFRLEDRAAGCDFFRTAGNVSELAARENGSLAIL